MRNRRAVAFYTFFAVVMLAGGIGHLVEGNRPWAGILILVSAIDFSIVAYRLLEAVEGRRP